MNIDKIPSHFWYTTMLGDDLEIGIGGSRDLKTQLKSIKEMLNDPEQAEDMAKIREIKIVLE